MIDRARSRPTLAEISALGVAALGFVLLVAIPTELRFPPDARDYLAYADAILAGRAFTSWAIDEVPRLLATRTPGFPLLLAASKLFFSDEGIASFALQGTLGLLTLLWVPLALRAACPVWLSAAIVLVCQWRMRIYFAAPLTEWTCFSLLLVLIAIVVRYGNAPTYGRLSLLGLVSAALILIRPALIVLAPLPAALALVVPLGLRRVRALAAACLPFLLVVAWMSVNLVRLGSFTLTPFGGTNLLGVAALIGHVEPEPGDDPDLEAFTRELNARKNPPPGAPLDLSAMHGWQDLAWRYRWNVHEVSEVIRREHGWSWVTFDRVLMTYAVRTIRAYPGRYLEYVLHELAALWPAVPLLLPSLVLPIVWLVRREHRGLALAALVALYIHVSAVALVAAVEVVKPRYSDLTYDVLLAASLWATAGLALSLVARPVHTSG